MRWTAWPRPCERIFVRSGFGAFQGDGFADSAGGARDDNAFVGEICECHVWQNNGRLGELQLWRIRDFDVFCGAGSRGVRTNRAEGCDSKFSETLAYPAELLFPEAFSW